MRSSQDSVFKLQPEPISKPNPEEQTPAVAPAPNQEPIPKSDLKPEPDPKPEPSPAKIVGAGIPNLGGTCYMNAALQVLYRNKLLADSIPILSKVLLEDAKFDVIRDLSKIFEYLSNPTVNGIRIQPCPRELVEKFFTALQATGAWRHLTSEQCDASEFVIYLLNYIQTSFNNIPQSQANALVDAALALNKITSDEMNTLKQIKFYRSNGDRGACVGVDLGFNFSPQTLMQWLINDQPDGEILAPVNPETQFSIPIAPTAAIKDLNAGLVALAQPEEISDYTDGIREKQPAMRRQKFVTLPQFLTIQVKRYTYDAAGGGCRKINDRFEFTNKIDLAPTTLDPKTPAPYQLLSIMAHSGSAVGGHYVAYAKINGVWFKFDDSSATEVPRSEIEGLYGNGTCGMNAYMLFYQRVE
ncbi:MAG: ubiquitin carboxyl-terminal hydrolase [Puniceicoccales bacterium]|nr:ubiquitin carboxyl-terminal hydrolase [Puniceicoccales bacterium]